MSNESKWPDDRLIAGAFEDVRQMLKSYASRPENTVQHVRAMLIALGLWYFDMAHNAVAESGRELFHKDIQELAREYRKRVKAKEKSGEAQEEKKDEPN